MPWRSHRDWRWCATPPSAAETTWRSVKPSHCVLDADETQTLWLRTTSPLKRGWYLFGIRHRGDNRRCTGWLVPEGQTSFRQGRPMYPVRRRWRVVRLPHSAHLLLELERVQQPLRLDELWLLRIPAWDAWRRIRRRLKAAGTKPELWRQYNQLLAGQARRHALVPYERWQRLVEQPAVEALAPLSAAERDQFHLYEFGDPAQLLPAGHWLVATQPGVTLKAWTLQAVAAAQRQKPGAQLLYGDEDQLTPMGERQCPQFKPAWNHELCWCDPHYSSCWFVAAELWNRWLASAPAQSPESWQQLVLTLQQQLSNPMDQIGHIPMVLSHRQGASVQEPLNPEQLEPFLPQGGQASVTAGGLGYRLHFSLAKTTCLSVIIPTRDRLELLQACLSSIDKHNPGCPIELVIADNGSREVQTLQWLQQFGAASSPERRQVVVKAAGPFNYSAINNLAVQHSQGSVLLLLNNDVEFLHPGWGYELASQALRPGIGCVGAQLLYPDHTIQHAGVVLGVGGLAGHGHQDFPGVANGYHRRLQLAQEVSAVTAACLAISRTTWDALGGLDAQQLAVNYNDVDLGLRAQAHGLRNLYLPQVRAIHHESKSRGRPEGAAFRQWRREWKVMEQRWGAELIQDQAYSPHCSLEAADFSLALRSGVPLVR
ncbi:glycosyltransferase [Synechococcus sp. A10-1-5-1]|uniref:glycosyltransferase family 2 protein n=1 Tax=Synechococcus sp. A10-1-5-1 TaxID=2936507 RepID=UPI002001522F|nr:glycosyltransferase [Synechococcus sp. A10-1-5-1]UPM49170.1 glycosyltransferase [Synechococcus sp. A10-1-5-1]